MLKYITAICLGLLMTGAAFAHGGGKDAYGCHNDTKTGGYHCH